MSADPNRCTINEAVRWLPVSRPTLTKWVRDQGAPFVKAPEGKGETWIVSVPDLVKWMVDTEVQKVLAKFQADTPAGEGKVDIVEAERRRTLAQALMAEVKLDRELRNVAPFQHYDDLVTKLIAPIQEGLDQHPNKAAAILKRRAGADPVIAAQVLRECVDKLKAKWAEQVDLDEPVSFEDYDDE